MAGTVYSVGEGVGGFGKDTVYSVGECLGVGGFGKVYEVQGPEGRPLVLKKSHITKHILYPMLRHEACALSLLAGHQMIPRAYAWGRSQFFEYLVMDRLGSPLTESVAKIHGRLNLRSVLLLLDQMFDILEYVHSRDIVHCDIKPDNFLFGITGGRCAGHVHLIDFGFSRSYRDSISKVHRPCEKKQKFAGTPYYASLNAHRGISPSPRDDLESLVYTIVWLLSGKLPWDRCKKRLVVEWKSRMTGAVLCSGLPQQFGDFFDYVRLLGYHKQPDYNRWRTTFHNLSHAFGYPPSGAFDLATASVNSSSIVYAALTPWSGSIAPRSSYNLTDDEDDDEQINSDDDDFMPTMDWPAPQGIDKRSLLGEEEEILKEKVAIITEPPVLLAGFPNDLYYVADEKMVF